MLRARVFPGKAIVLVLIEGVLTKTVKSSVTAVTNSTSVGRCSRHQV